METKVDGSYEEFFSSIGIAIITCTLLVSVGKYITCYYFLYIVACLLLALMSLTIYDYKYGGESRNLEEAGEVQYSSTTKLTISKKKNIKHKLMSVDKYSANNCKEVVLRKRPSMKKENRQYLREADIILGQLRRSKSERYTPEENYSRKRGCDDSMKERKIIPKSKGKLGTLLIKEVDRSLMSERHLEINNYFRKEEQICM